MRSLALPLAVAALLALGGLLAVELLGPSAPATRAELAQQIAAELRCPDCEGLSVADSRTPAALEISRQIDALLADGRSPDQVRRHFVDRYGEWILLAPSSRLAWLAPIVILLAALGGLAAWLLLGRRPDEAGTSGPAPTPRDVERVRDEVEALDA